MRKHRLGKQLLIVLCVVLIVFLAGCRPSPVLEQIIYEQNHQVDPDTETKTMNDDLENEEPDEDIPSRETVDDSEQTKGESHTAALAGDTDTSDDTDAVYDVEYSSVGELSEPDETNPTEGSTSETATGSTEPGGDEGGYAPSGEGGESGNDGISGESDAGTSAGEEPEGGSEAGADEGGDHTGTDYEPTNEPIENPRQVTDASGNTVDIPQNVDTVTAVGEAATIVEMLGGSGRLVGTSNDYYGSNWAFDLSGTNVWWSGDGSSACNNFDALLAAHPDVCFEISGDETFSTDQITRLNEAGIAYVVLWPLNTIGHIEDDVNLVGQVLGNRESDGLTNAESIASNYCSWADNTIKRASGNYSTKATTYIGWWDDTAVWEIHSLQGRGTLASGNGAPVGMAYISSAPLAECMGYAGVSNSTADNYYVEPLYSLSWEPTITGATAARYRSYVNIIYSDEVGVGLGTEAYPAVIVANSGIRDDMWNANSNYFNYHWQAGDMIPYGTSVVYGIDLGDGTFLSTRIQNTHAYKILVNPSGVGSWANGSVESPLEAAWLACEFQGSISMSEMQNMVTDFYNTYYGVSPNNYNLSDIMPEDWTYDQ